MTKKDYILIANVLNGHTHSPAVRDFSLDLAKELRRDNPRFDLAKFLSAAGMSTGIRAA